VSWTDSEAADYIIGTSHEDYSHMCIDHNDEYVNQNDKVISIIRAVCGGEQSGRRETPEAGRGTTEGTEEGEGSKREKNG
jgi:hypothetical protein